MTKLIELACNNCGATLEIDLRNPKIECTYCKAQYIVKELITENRLNNIDAVYRLTPLAENAISTFQYGDALNYYRRLINYDPTEVNIARYNICMVGTEEVEPTIEVFNTLRVLDDEERYKHLHHIKGTARKVMFNRIKYLRNYGGTYRIKETINVIKWYRGYKKLDLMVRPLECACGKTLGGGSLKCSCGRTREETVEQYKVKKHNAQFTVGIVIVALLTFIISHLF